MLRSGKCRGPFRGYGKPQDGNPADMTMYIGDEESYDSPWSVGCKFIIFNYRIYTHNLASGVYQQIRNKVLF